MEAQNGAVEGPWTRDRRQHFDEEQDPHPHQSKKSDPDLHRNEKRNPDPQPGKLEVR
jgi:hypothetical protein